MRITRAVRTARATRRIKPFAPRNWLCAFAADSAAPTPGTDAQQLAALRRENELLREERESLKKALGIFSRVPRS